MPNDLPPELSEPPAQPDTSEQSEIPGNSEMPGSPTNNTVLREIVKATTGLSNAYKAAILAGTLFVVVALAALAAQSTFAAIVILALVCGTTALLVLPIQTSVKGSATVFIFALIALSLVKFDFSGDSERTFIPIVRSGQSVLSGIVMDSSHTAVENAVVRPLGDAEHTAATNDVGRFYNLVVPNVLFKKDSLQLTVHHTRLDTVPIRWDHRDVTLILKDGPIALKEGAMQFTSMMALPSFTVESVRNSIGTAQQDSLIAVTLDSVRAVHDDAPGDLSWEFQINIGSEGFALKKTTYNDSTERQLLVVGAETHIPMNTDSLQISIMGTRRKLLFPITINGRASILPRDLNVDTTLRLRIPVFKPGHVHTEGLFWFYVTIFSLARDGQRAEQVPTTS